MILPSLTIYKNYNLSVSLSIFIRFMSLVSLFIRHASTFDFSGLKLTKVKGELLLKKHGEEGGDDIDHDRRLLSSSDDYTSGKVYIIGTTCLFSSIFTLVLYFTTTFEAI